MRFDKLLFRVLVSAVPGRKLDIEVAAIPARFNSGSFSTPQGIHIQSGSLLTADCISSDSQVVVCVYAETEEDIEAAISIAWEAARDRTATGLSVAQQLFGVAHGKPVIKRLPWVPG